MCMASRVLRGGDDSWYAGTILEVHEGGTATVIYDDGEEWTGRLNEIYLLQGESDEHDAPAAQPAVPASTSSVQPAEARVLDRSR